MSYLIFPRIHGSSFPLAYERCVWDQMLAHQHCMSGLIPSNSLHLLFCAQILHCQSWTRSRYSKLLSVLLFLPHLVLLVCDAYRISLFLVRNVHTSFGKGCASVRITEPPADWGDWFELAVELCRPCASAPTLLIIFLDVSVYFCTRNSVLHHQPNFRHTVASLVSFPSLLFVWRAVLGWSCTRCE